MTKTILIFGLIAGVLLAAISWIIYSLCFNGFITFDNSTYIGYAGMLIVFSMVYFGIKSYRDNSTGGSLTFWKGVQVGLLIALVASVIHAAGWHVYNVVNPDFKDFFVDKYAEYKLNDLSAPYDHDARAAIDREIEMLRTVYENPVLDFLVSGLMMLPPALIVTLLSAAMLRKKPTPAG